MKKVIIIALLIICFAGCTKKVDEQQIINSTNIQDVNKENELIMGNKKKQKLDSELISTYISVINQSGSLNEQEKLRYDLIYFNNDDIPELVVELPSHWLMIYTYKNGEAIDITSKNGGLGLGTVWNSDYSYAPKKSIITNTGHDSKQFAYENYYETDQNGDLINSYTIQTVLWDEKDRSEIGELIYTNLSECEFEILTGSKTRIEMIAELEEKSIEEVEHEQTNAINWGNKKYEEIHKIYLEGFEYDFEKQATINGKICYKIQNINAIKSILSEDKLDFWFGIKKINEEFYSQYAGYNAEKNYITTVLLPNKIEEEKIIYDAISYFLSDAGVKKLNEAGKTSWEAMRKEPIKFIEESSEVELKKTNKKFILLKENDVWKVSQFIIPSGEDIVEFKLKKVIKITAQDIENECNKIQKKIDYSEYYEELNNPFYELTPREIKYSERIFVDLNGDNQLEELYSQKTGAIEGDYELSQLYLNGKPIAKQYVKNEWTNCGIIDLDKEDGQLQLVVAAVPISWKGYGLLLYEKGEIINVWYLNKPMIDGYGSIIEESDIVCINVGETNMLTGYRTFKPTEFGWGIQHSKKIKYNAEKKYMAKEKIIFSEKYDEIKQCVDWTNNINDNNEKAFLAYRNEAEILQEGTEFCLINVEGSTNIRGIPLIRLEDGREGYIIEYNANWNWLRQKNK